MESEATTCRVIFDGPGEGAWNMALDEALLEAAVDGESNGPTLRWYQWSEPTLSLGYFQSYADRPDALLNLPTVRRLTGGGAILHDRELTYSFVAPSGNWPRSTARLMVDAVHRIIAAALGQGVKLHGVGELEGAAEPFLCFQRRCDVDLVLGRQKVVGTAQRTRRGALLQHGSILLDSSDYARHLPGLGERDWRRKAGELAKTATAMLGEELGWEMTADSPTARELALARSFVVDRYRQDSWNQRR
jgi:lipoate-protein ligase A